MYHRITSTSVSNRCCVRLLGWYWNWRVVIAWQIWCGTDYTGSLSHTGSPSNCASLHINASTVLLLAILPNSADRSRSRLRSAAAGGIPPIHTSTYGELNFAYLCPTAWNNLPSELNRSHKEMSLHTFKKALKTHFFLHRLDCLTTRLQSLKFVSYSFLVASIFYFSFGLFSLHTCTRLCDSSLVWRERNVCLIIIITLCKTVPTTAIAQPGNTMLPS